jgi:hypothetical protein
MQIYDSIGEIFKSSLPHNMGTKRVEWAAMFAADATVMAATHHVFTLHVLVHGSLQNFAAWHMIRQTAITP